MPVGRYLIAAAVAGAGGTLLAPKFSGALFGAWVASNPMLMVFRTLLHTGPIADHVMLSVHLPRFYRFSQG